MKEGDRVEIIQDPPQLWPVMGVLIGKFYAMWRVRLDNRDIEYVKEEKLRLVKEGDS